MEKKKFSEIKYEIHVVQILFRGVYKWARKMLLRNWVISKNAKQQQQKLNQYVNSLRLVNLNYYKYIYKWDLI